MPYHPKKNGHDPKYIGVSLSKNDFALLIALQAKKQTELVQRVNFGDILRLALHTLAKHENVTQ